jgi:hypothetical protein
MTDEAVKRMAVEGLAQIAEISRLIERRPVAHRSCERCNSTEWVCEHHPTKPWGDALNAGPRACHCGGAGKPCTECNPLSKERRDV